MYQAKVYTSWKIIRVHHKEWGMSEEIIDLDAMRPEKQIVEVAGKKIDTSMISFGIVLDLIDKMEGLGDGKKNTRKMLSVFGDIIDQILKESDKDIDDKWIKENINGFMYMTLIDKIVTPLLESTTASATGTKKKEKV